MGDSSMKEKVVTDMEAKLANKKWVLVDSDNPCLKLVDVDDKNSILVFDISKIPSHLSVCGFLMNIEKYGIAYIQSEKPKPLSPEELEGKKLKEELDYIDGLIRKLDIFINGHNNLPFTNLDPEEKSDLVGQLQAMKLYRHFLVRRSARRGLTEIFFPESNEKVKKGERNGM